VAFVRDAGDIGALALDGGAWSQLQPVMSRRVWSDDYSTILTPVLDMIRDKQKADGH
jgi:hypothetical protein